MAVKAGAFPLEYTAKELTAAFDDAPIITKLEAGKYHIKQKDLNFALYRNEEFLSVAWLKPVIYDGKEYDQVSLFFTPKENRKLGYSTTLLYALKELRKNPLLFDGPIFDNGWAFLEKIVKTHAGAFQTVKTLNKRTGVISDFTGASPKKIEAFIVENDEFGFYLDAPEPFGKVYFNMFSKVLNESEFED